MTLLNTVVHEPSVLRDSSKDNVQRRPTIIVEKAQEERMSVTKQAQHEANLNQAQQEANLEKAQEGGNILLDKENHIGFIPSEDRRPKSSIITFIIVLCS